jgi:hypothetical protein
MVAPLENDFDGYSPGAAQLVRKKLPTRCWK